eukprot:2936411-Prorocentrum_lima.AAC.1
MAACWLERILFLFVDFEALNRETQPLETLTTPICDVQHFKKECLECGFKATADWYLAKHDLEM